MWFNTSFGTMFDVAYSLKHVVAGVLSLVDAAYWAFSWFIGTLLFNKTFFLFAWIRDRFAVEKNSCDCEDGSYSSIMPQPQPQNLGDVSSKSRLVPSLTEAIITCLIRQYPWRVMDCKCQVFSVWSLFIMGTSHRVVWEFLSRSILIAR